MLDEIPKINPKKKTLRVVPKATTDRIPEGSSGVQPDGSP